jgi:hypothetical protein
LYLGDAKKPHNMKKLFMLIVIVAIGYNAMAQCNPSFTYSQPTLSSGSGGSVLSVIFTNTTVFTPNDSEVVSYGYDYGDGTSGGGEHTYTNAGTYNVTLSMYVMYNDSLGMGNTPICSNTYTQQVTVTASTCATAVTTSVSDLTSNSATLNVVANNLAGTSGMTYTWDFGDGSTGSGASTSHAYTTSGYYTVALTATNGSCMFTNSVPETVMVIDCGDLSANFSYTATYNTAGFDDMSSPIGFNVGYTTGQSSWDYGDGTSDGAGQHSYAAAGTYSVTLTHTWAIDSTSPYANTCTHSVTLPVTVGNPPNRIAGAVLLPALSDSFTINSPVKVWLVKLDTDIISAIDSVISNVNSSYQFNNEPNGAYMVKAALTNNPTPPDSIGIVPTYDSASLYWSGAHTINHTGGDDENNNIHMQLDTVTSGPGFVAGNVLTGAGKGTGAGEPVPGMLIYLRNTATGRVVDYQYTDANGNYSFSSVAIGNYDTYPEADGYATTPFAFTITSSQTSVSNVSFRENTSTMTITPTTTGINTIAANTTKLNIYPNPTSGQVTIQYRVSAAQDAHISITNVLGQKVYDGTLNLNSGNGSAKLDVSALADGMYMVSIKSDNAIDYNQKLMIQH